MKPNIVRSCDVIAHVFCTLTLSIGTAYSQSNTYPPRFEDANEAIYKSVDDVELKLWVFTPADHEPTDKRPAAVFFFGGGWKGGNPSQFAPHCRYLASRGMVAITADYRVRSRHETLADRCVADAKSAIRYVRDHAKHWGVDPDRIVAGGGSAGGHLAACTATVSELDEPDEDPSISSVPNACVLFNPALLIAPFNDVTLDEQKIADIATRTGVEPRKISPIHNVREGLPPMLVFHGTDDTAVPYRTIQAFRDVYRSAGNSFHLNTHKGQAHGFFNFGRGGLPGEHFTRTIDAMDRFLGDLGYLDGQPTVAVPTSPHVHVRSELRHSIRAMSQEKTATVAFIGGSITEMNGYRPMIMEHLSETFPQTRFNFVNAGIASTCSTTGAFRLSRDVLRHRPDLVFVEFAVNDDQDAAHATRECVRGMEGIIRRIKTEDPTTDVIITHFVNPEMLQQIRDGDAPTSITAHERVASHYGICSVNLAAEVADRIDGGKLTWEEYGGTHPKSPGNRVAADLNIQALGVAWGNSLTETGSVETPRLPKAIDNKSYDKGRLLNVTAAKFGSLWRLETPDWSSLPGKSRERFTGQKLLCAQDAGAKLSVTFQGSAIGAFVLAGPDAGAVEYSIDGGPTKRVDLYHRYSEKLHYPRTVMFDADLEPTEHRLELRIGDRPGSSSGGHAVRILDFVVNESRTTK